MRRGRTDLQVIQRIQNLSGEWQAICPPTSRCPTISTLCWPNRRRSLPARRARWHWRRSEEHTSELQSLMRISYAVFCLKKKRIKRVLLSVTIQEDQRRQIEQTHKNKYINKKQNADIER